ncbi:MAG: COG1361 S-layer family protein, partial [Methermicoccaceae archaeon]
GDYLDVWVKVENRAPSRAEEIEIRIEPTYPLSLLPSESGYWYVGLLSVGDAAIKKVRMVVAEGAPDGDVPLKIYYKTKVDSEWGAVKHVDSEWNVVEPTISVGSDTLNSRGTVVLSSYTLYPETLIAGDEGRLDVVLSNTASQRTMTIGSEVYSLDARIQRAELLGTEDVVVESPTYRGAGVLAPGDSITLSYSFRVNNSAQEGTRLLNFSAVAGSRAYSTTWRIPLKVEMEHPKVIQSKQGVLTGGSGTLEVEVANVRDGSLKAVSLIPESDVLEFEPAEYFVGEMNPNELYTVEFTLYATGQLEAGQTLPVSLTVRYNNGDNTHFSDPVVVYITATPQPSGGGTFWLMLAVVVVGAGAFYWWRKKRKG